MLLLLSLSFSFFPSLSRSPQVSLTLDKLAFSLSLTLFFRSNQHFPTHSFFPFSNYDTFPSSFPLFSFVCSRLTDTFSLFLPIFSLPLLLLRGCKYGHTFPSFLLLPILHKWVLFSRYCVLIYHSPLLSPLRIRVNLAKHVARYSAF